MTQIVNGLLISQHRLLMGLRSATRRKYAGKWSFPGGHVEAGETLEEALVRELEEEVGITAQSFKYYEHIERSEQPTSTLSFHMFVVSEWAGVLKKLGDEHTELRWVSFQDAMSLPDLALPEYKALFNALHKSDRLR